MLLALDPSKGLGASPARIEPLLQTTFNESNAEISPDGHWLAYQSDESNQNEIYVRPFPKVSDGRWQISTSGGITPVWARSGRELFFRNGPTLLSVAVQTTPTFSAGNPTKMFEGRYAAAGIGRNYDVSLDGQRFLMIKDSATTDDKATPASMVVVEHWFEELKRLVPPRP